MIEGGKDMHELPLQAFIGPAMVADVRHRGPKQAITADDLGQTTCDTLERGDRLLLRAFFFQAEDGIRDYKVTGVQTCALPILRPLKGQRKGPASGEAAGPGRKMPMPWWRAWGRDLRGREEKAPRLGGIRCWPEIGRASCRERCRSRWSPYH